MTALSSQLSLRFKVTGVTGNSFDVPTTQYVRKRIEKILYLESPPDDAVLLSYVGTKEISPDNNLYIGDRSDLLYANSRNDKLDEYIGSGSTSFVHARNSNFIVTQKFNSSGVERIPLYYKCILPSTTIPESIKIFDKDFNEVGRDQYLIEIDYDRNETTGTKESTINRCIVFNSLLSNYDNDSGEYEIYFVQYADSATASNTITTTLLNNILAYTEATFDDIWSVTLELKPWCFAYTWDNAALDIGLPGSEDYAIKYNERERLCVKEPTALNDERPWFLRITNNIVNTSYSSTVTKYSIPEFENQAFSPYAPYKTAVLVSARKIDDHIVQLQHKNLQTGDGVIFSYFYLLLQLEGAVQYAITNDPSKSGSKYRDIDNNFVTDVSGNTVYWSSDYLLGVNNISGFVHVSPYVKDSYDILATYSYEENSYELSTLNMNPVFDSNATNELRVVYIVPASTPNNNLSSQTQSVHWIRVSKSGKIIATNQDGTGNNPNINKETYISSDGYVLTGAIGLYYNTQANCVSASIQDVLPSISIQVDDTSSFPKTGWIRFEDTDGLFRYAKYIDKTSTSLELSSVVTEVPDGIVYIQNGSDVSLVNFVDEYSTMTTRDGLDEINHVPSGVYPSVFARYFILAEVSINPPHSPGEAVTLDVRQAGGGLLEEKYNEAKLKNPQAQWLLENKSYDGQVYPGNAVIVIKLPISLLSRYTKLEIADVVQKNIPMGVQPIIRYYGYQPNIIYIGPSFE